MADEEDDREQQTEREVSELTSLEAAQFEALLAASNQASNQDAEDLEDALQRLTASDDHREVGAALTHTGQRRAWRPHFRAQVPHEWRPHSLRRRPR